MNEERIKDLIENDKEWRRHILTVQSEIFDKIDSIEHSYSEKKIDCERRFTRLEVKAGIIGLVAGGVGSGLFYFLTN